MQDQWWSWPYKSVTIMSLELQQCNLCQQQLLYRFNNHTCTAMLWHSCKYKYDGKAESGVCSALRVACAFVALSTQQTRCMHGVQQHPPSACQLRIWVSNNKSAGSCATQTTSFNPTQVDHPGTDSGALDSSSLCSLYSACFNSQYTKPGLPQCMQQYTTTHR